MDQGPAEMPRNRLPLQIIPVPNFQDAPGPVPFSNALRIHLKRFGSHPRITRSKELLSEPEPNGLRAARLLFKSLLKKTLPTMMVSVQSTHSRIAVRRCHPESRRSANDLFSTPIARMNAHLSETGANRSLCLE